MASNTPVFFQVRSGKTSGLSVSTISDMVVLSDGSIVVVDRSTSGSFVSAGRLKSDGTVDTSYWNSGYLADSDYQVHSADVSIGQASTQGTTSVEVQADGKLIIAGSSAHIGTSSRSPSDFKLIRYNADGSADTTFSGDGIVQVGIGAGNDFATSMALQSNGKILVAGYSYNTAKNYDFSIIRLNTDGSLDRTFSGDGKAMFDIPSGVDSGGNDVLMDMQVYSSSMGSSAGKILLAGYSVRATASGYHDFSLIRLKSDGSLDTTFSGDGKATFDVASSNDYCNSADVIASGSLAGRILLAGYSYNWNYSGDGIAASKSNDFSVVRLTSSGALDTSFSSDGKVLVDIGSKSNDVCHDMVVLADGSILLVGSTTSTGSSTGSDMAIVKLTKTGALDTTFSSDGKLILDLGTVSDAAYSVTVQTDGKILVAGGAVNDFTLTNDGVVIRLNADGSLDTSFGNPVSEINSSVAYTENAAAVQLNANIAIDGLDSYEGSSITIGRDIAISSTGEILGGDGNMDDVFSGIGNLLLDFSTGEVALDGNGDRLIDAAEVIGSVISTNGAGGGVVTISFDAQASEANVNEVLQSIAYSNVSDLPDLFANIGWIFSDGNQDVEGSAQAQAISANTSVTITQVNDAPTGSVFISWNPNSPTSGDVLTVTGLDNIRDADNIATDGSVDPTAFSYQWYANGLKISGATKSTLTLSQTLIGKTISVKAMYYDQGGVKEAVSSTTSAAVVYKAAPSDADASLRGTNLRDWLVGLDGDDSAQGYAGNDVLEGNDGNDTLDGGTGADSLLGGSGDDVLLGGTGGDTLIGGLGSDTLTGGDTATSISRDVFRFSTKADLGTDSNTADHITDFSSSDVIDLSGIDANVTASGNQAFTFSSAMPTSAGLIYYSAADQALYINTGDGNMYEIDFTGATSLTALTTANVVL